MELFVIDCRDLHFPSLVINYPHARARFHGLPAGLVGWMRKTTGLLATHGGTNGR